MKKQFKITLTVSVVTGLFFVVGSAAALCVKESYQEQYCKADYVFIGELDSKNSNNTELAIAVSRVFKGSPENPAYFKSPKDLLLSTDILFTSGHKYLIFATKVGNLYATNLCSGTVALNETVAEREQLQMYLNSGTNLCNTND